MPLVFSGLYLLDDRVETHVGFAASMLVFLLGDFEYAPAAALAVTAVVIAVGGRPLQAAFRRSVLRRNGLEEA